MIPSRNRLALEIPDSQGSIRRKRSLEYDSKRHSSADTGSTDSDKESEPPAQLAKRRRVLSQLSACHHCQATVSASATRSSPNGHSTERR
jgi:hypothetical protein